MVAQGNDFVVVDGRTQEVPEPDAAWITRCCDRRLGVGCDQLLLLEKHGQADVAMRVFNSDGSEAEHCGNGARCVGALLLRETGRARVRIALADRTLAAFWEGDAVSVEMGAARIVSSDAHGCAVEIGNPHRVCFDMEAQPDPAWNTEIVTGYSEGRLWIDVIERGAGRTPACGSGACAAAVAWWARSGRVAPLTVVMPGGAVQVSGTPEALLLTAPVEVPFHGSWNIAGGV